MKKTDRFADERHSNGARGILETGMFGFNSDQFADKQIYRFSFIIDKVSHPKMDVFGLNLNEFTLGKL